MRGAISLISAPAANAFWEPVRRIARIVGDWSKEERAALSSVMRGVERAFRALGRLSVTMQRLTGSKSKRGRRSYSAQLLVVALTSR